MAVWVPGTIEWGAYEASGGVNLRVGIKVDVEDSISAGEIYCNFDVTYYTQTDSAGKYNSDAQTLNLSGAINASINYTNNQGAGAGAVNRGTRSHRYEYGVNSYGSSPGTVTFAAQVS